MSASRGNVELQEIAEQVVKCKLCDLCLAATNAVPGDGPADARVMLVGEAPGFNEDKQGRPFVGAAGKFLEELLGVAGLKRSEVFVTNVVKHRPPENRPPKPDELLACRPYLERQIATLQPKLIVTLGRFSLETFFPPSGPGTGISRVHGQVRERDGRYFFHSYHPAAALHKQELRQTLIDDMKQLAAFLQGPFALLEVNAHAEEQNSSSDPAVSEGAEQLPLF